MNITDHRDDDRQRGVMGMTTKIESSDMTG